MNQPLEIVSAIIPDTKMTLRHILIALSLLAFLSASAGGVMYYTSLRHAAFQEARQQTVVKTELVHKRLNSLLSEHRKNAITLAGMPALKQALQDSANTHLREANMLLDHFSTTLSADVCYLMNAQGETIASSNRHDPDSFVDQNFAFRPYFAYAMAGINWSYMALGVASGKRGVYHSSPIYGQSSIEPIGVAVIKASIEEIEMELGVTDEDIVLVTNEQGLIFISNRPDWLYELAWAIDREQIKPIEMTRQFGRGPWRWVGLQATDDTHVRDKDGERYLMHRTAIDRFPGWEIVYLRSTHLIAQSVSGPLLRIVGPAAILLSMLVGLSVLVLYRKASQEINRRRNAEEALRHSENRYRSLYHHTPAMLHSIDRDGKLLSVSDFWLDTMGYSRDEVLHRPLADFFAPDSRDFALTKGIPHFFKHGYINGVSYRMLKKSGDTMDVMLSAIADRDADGIIQRSLAVSVDMTQRNRAEEALRIAKEELDRYSKQLERQVRERTSEITAILKYTPAVVYMKDARGRYLMVNSRFESIFGVDEDTVRGKCDADLLPPSVAAQFSAHDETVLTRGISLQVEEQVSHVDGMHIYLSVKFPIYETDGKIMAVCGILTDITALKTAQEQLRRLSGSIMANQEKERTSIARELHDELGQLLTAVRMDAIWLHERFKDKDCKATERAAAICSLVDTTIEEVRAMAIRLRPGVLDDLGLVDALELFTNEFERRMQIPCIFVHNGRPTVDDAIATAAYRIAQEALTNVARHAQATRSEIRLHMDQDTLVLKVSDNGRGFEPESLPQVRILGLAGMRERAVLVGGTLAVKSALGQGTRVTLRVPLALSMESAA
jgi:PAS domain S-box-containing protein